MPGKSGPKSILLVAVLLLLAAGPKNLNAQSICIDQLNVDVGSTLQKKLKESNFEVSKVKQKLVERIGDIFIENSIGLKSSSENYDFKIEGTVEALDMLDNTRGFLILFNANSLRVLPSSSKNFLPTMTFGKITGSENSEFNFSHSTVPLIAVQSGVDCFVDSMKQKGVFYFNKHPLFRQSIELNKRIWEEQDRTDSEQINIITNVIGNIKNEIKTTLHVELEALFTGLNKQINIEFKKDFQTLLKKIEALEILIKQQKKFDKKNVEKLETLVHEVNSRLSKIKEDYKLINYIIVFVKKNADIPLEFKQTYIKPKACNNCSEREINAGNVKKMSRKEDIDLLGQNAEYGYPLELAGEIRNGNGIITIVLPEESYNKIFSLNNRCNLPPGEVLDGIKNSKNDYARLFVMEKKD